MNYSTAFNHPLYVAAKSAVKDLNVLPKAGRLKGCFDIGGFNEDHMPAVCYYHFIADRRCKGGARYIKTIWLRPSVDALDLVKVGEALLKDLE